MCVVPALIAEPVWQVRVKLQHTCATPVSLLTGRITSWGREEEERSGRLLCFLETWLHPHIHPHLYCTHVSSLEKCKFPQAMQTLTFELSQSGHSTIKWWGEIDLLFAVWAQVVFTLVKHHTCASSLFLSLLSSTYLHLDSVNMTSEVTGVRWPLGCHSNRVLNPEAPVISRGWADY